MAVEWLWRVVTHISAQSALNVASTHILIMSFIKYAAALLCVCVFFNSRMVGSAAGKRKISEFELNSEI